MSTNESGGVNRKTKLRQKINSLVDNELLTGDDLKNVYDTLECRVTSKSTCDWAHKRCIKCGLRRTAQGHDPCIANLPGVKNACCGHGDGDAYIEFLNGTVVRGDCSIELEESKMVETGEKEVEIRIVGDATIEEFRNGYGFGFDDGWKPCGTCKACRMGKIEKAAK
jgi:hypothetical protein